MRKTLLALAASILIAIATPDPGHAATIKIASWNLEHLAELSGAGCKPREDADYETARKYADLLDADVIAFQEVESAAAASRVFSSNRYNIEISTQKLRAGYQCDRNKPASGQSTRQLTGFAIRKGIRYVRNPDFEPLDVSDNNSLRAATEITLQGKYSLRLLSVHLKASCTSQPLPSERRDCKTLEKQQPILEQWMEVRHQAGEVFAVLGDFNRHLLTPGDAFWAQTEDGEPASLHMTVLSSPNEGLCSKKYPKRIDHIVVDNESAKQVQRDSFRVLTYQSSDEPSDHCPISVMLSSK